MYSSDCRFLSVNCLVSKRKDNIKHVRGFMHRCPVLSEDIHSNQLYENVHVVLLSESVVSRMKPETLLVFKRL